MSLAAKPLRCSCPDAFHATVLDTLPGSIRLVACLRCGAAELAEAILDEPRPHDVQLLGCEIHDLTPEARAWATAWPRFLETRRPRVYLPATARFDTEAELAAATPRTFPTLRETLLTLGAPPDHPPASLPAALDGFREIWHGLRLNAETPIDDLLDAATRWNGPHKLAEDVLALRTDLVQYAAAYVGNFSEKNRQYGRYLIKTFQLTAPIILTALRTRLAEIPDNQTGEIAELARVVSNLGSAAHSARPELESAAKRIESTDYYGHKELVELLAKLK